MSLRSCIITLILVYPFFLAAGVWLYRYMQKTKPQPFPAGDRRNKMARTMRFLMHVVLLPVGVTAAVAVLGWLDPLFHLVQAVRR